MEKPSEFNANNWRDGAACAGETDVFDPDADKETKEFAIEICGSCAVWAFCLEYAEATNQKFGIWGGVDFQKRDRAKSAERYRRWRRERAS